MHENTNQVFDNKVKLDLSSSKITLKNSGRVIDRETDIMGRWSYQFLACKDNRHLVVKKVWQVYLGDKQMKGMQNKKKKYILKKRKTIVKKRKYIKRNK